VRIVDISNDMTKSGAIRDQQKITTLDQARGKSVRKSQGPQAEDKIALSDQAQLLSKLGRAVDDSPDVREEKVAAIREAVKQQKYEISYSEIAKAILASRGK
jgi:flagellar biosynthesis anti-sigma factor FlgM